MFDTVRHCMPYVVRGRFVYSIFGLTRIPPNFKINIMYNSSIMTIQDWASLIVAILTIVSSIAFGIKWLVKHYLIELKPNSGSSLKDQVSRLESRINEADEKRSDMNRKLDHMYDILLQYISKNSK